MVCPISSARTGPAVSSRRPSQMVRNWESRVIRPGLYDRAARFSKCEVLAPKTAIGLGEDAVPDDRSECDIKGGVGEDDEPEGAGIPIPPECAEFIEERQAQRREENKP